jgi:hypothetical protein
MVPDQIDKALKDWQAKLMLISSNLLELETLPISRRLRGDAQMPKVTFVGHTQSAVETAFNAIDNLWHYHQALTEVLTQATKLYKALPKLWVFDHQLEEIKQLLYGKSVKLPTASTPITQRSLLSAIEDTTTITPDDLLHLMTNQFDIAKGIILSIDQAWSHLLPELEKVENETASLKYLALSLGSKSLNECEFLEQQLSNCRTQIESNPLAANADLSNNITPLLEKLRLNLTNLNSQREQCRSELKRAQTLYKELEELNNQSRKVWTECQTKIETSKILQTPLSTDEIAELYKWLQTLIVTEQNNWNAAKIGLERWLKNVTDYLVAVKKSITANQSILEMRAELKGRLSSLQAKAQSYKLRGIITDSSLDILAQQAMQALHRQPTPLETAIGLVNEYENRLSKCLKI